MGVLRDRMVREMPLREFSASTQKLYLATLTDLAKYHHRSPDMLDPTHPAALGVPRILGEKGDEVEPGQLVSRLLTD